MGLVRIPLSEQEEAHLALILDLHKADVAQIDRLRQEADQRQTTRIGPLTRAKNIPEATFVSVEGRTADTPCFLTYATPDIAPQPETPPQPDAGS